MQEQMPFDPNYYFGLVADNLLKNLGEEAIGYAGKALSKMKAMGDDEGFDIWLNIHEHLTMKASNSLRPNGAVLH